MIRILKHPALKALEGSKRFEAPMKIEDVAELAKPFLSLGNQYGEGWFLTGEMAELLQTGVPNIVCIQPFACLPNLKVVDKDSAFVRALQKLRPSLVYRFKAWLEKRCDAVVYIGGSIFMEYPNWENICSWWEYEAKTYLDLAKKDENYGENEVVEVLQKGYTRGDKVIRYAVVKVAN